jgi:hypothetical protein
MNIIIILLSSFIFNLATFCCAFCPGPRNMLYKCLPLVTIVNIVFTLAAANCLLKDGLSWLSVFGFFWCLATTVCMFVNSITFDDIVQYERRKKRFELASIDGY